MKAVMFKEYNMKNENWYGFGLYYDYYICWWLLYDLEKEYGVLSPMHQTTDSTIDPTTDPTIDPTSITTIDF